MNFLAHAFLSGDNDKVLTGNFIADFVKGRTALSGFENTIARGIELHRLIDSYTDNHPVVLESKKRLRQKYRHYSAVIVDVFYDHFLASNWEKYHNKTLAIFSESVYQKINRYLPACPPEFAYMFRYMIRGNWLLNYSNVEGISRTLSGMASRTPYESKMDEAIEDLTRDFNLYKQEFETFFPQLRQTCDDWLHKNNL